MNRKQQRELLATLIAGGRKDLAVTVAKLFVGDTYHAREHIKRNRGRWNPNQKAWDVPEPSVPGVIKELEQKGFNVMEHSDRVEVRRKDRGGSPSQVSKRPATKSSPASPKQVQYAESLINRLVRSGDWHDSNVGQGMYPPRRADLQKMSSRDISGLIDALRSEFR